MVIPQFIRLQRKIISLRLGFQGVAVGKRPARFESARRGAGAGLACSDVDPHGPLPRAVGRDTTLSKASTNHSYIPPRLKDLQHAVVYAADTTATPPGQPTILCGSRAVTLIRPFGECPDWLSGGKTEKAPFGVSISPLSAHI